jgi:hypothetical protein
VADLTFTQKAIVTECLELANYGQVVMNERGYYLNSPRLGRRINLELGDIDALVEAGYGQKNRYGGFTFNLAKCEELHTSLVETTTKPHPEHPGKHIQVVNFACLLD